MANFISLSAVVLGCILLTHAEPPASVNSYSINGENNGFEYNSNIINGAYIPGKEGHRENMDFYGGGNTGHSLTNSRSQGNLDESLRSSSYNGFSPSSHNTGFSTTYTTAATHDNLASSSYFPNNAAQSSFDSYNNNNNADSAFEAYTQGSDQAGSDFNQFSANKHKNPSYMRFSDNISGATSTGSYPETSEASSFRGDYSGDSFRSHTSQNTGFIDNADPAFNREVSNFFNSPSTDYSYGKHKENTFGGSNKFMTDIYSMNPDTRYVRGNHGNVGRDYASSMFLANSGQSSPFGNVRGNAGAYGSGKFGKYNKHSGDYTSSAGLNYLSKEQDVDYLLSSYGKGSGKLAVIKEGRPSSYVSQSYLGGPSYLNKIIGSYKSKPSFMNSYHSSSPIGYSSMSGLHGSSSGNSYADSPPLRRYRSNSYIPGHVSPYPGYY
ncbi:putative uncharacterized protein DDB_G0282133 isoform X1 [Bombus impatiens]|uniref:Uncharacterized protein n=2 Tax=Bombus impatiens TaxID=132113 RepID=A0A6P6FB46_BOMIM|nr:putative uncharacterized protein DDB_G0282133 isoform X1 [Bombus impatiens]